MKAVAQSSSTESLPTGAERLANKTYEATPTPEATPREITTTDKAGQNHTRLKTPPNSNPVAAGAPTAESTEPRIEPGDFIFMVGLVRLALTNGEEAQRRDPTEQEQWHHRSVVDCMLETTTPDEIKRMLALKHGVHTKDAADLLKANMGPAIRSEQRKQKEAELRKPAILEEMEKLLKRRATSPETLYSHGAGCSSSRAYI